MLNMRAVTSEGDEELAGEDDFDPEPPVRAEVVVQLVVSLAEVVGAEGWAVDPSLQRLKRYIPNPNLQIIKLRPMTPMYSIHSLAAFQSGISGGVF